MELFRCIVVIATLGLTGCQEDPEEAANRLFVESSALLAQYEELPQDNVEGRLALLQQVQENLQRVVSDYPGSSLAVEIVSTGMARNIELSYIESSIINESANILVIESSLLLTQYEEIPEADFEQRLSILQQIQENLEDIVSEYPRSSLAVDIISTGMARNIEISYIEGIITSIEDNILCPQDFYACVRLEAHDILNNLEVDEYYYQHIYAYASIIFGNINEAIDATRRITDERYSMEILQYISEIQASSGDIEGALYTARLIENEVSRSRALAAAGDIEGALQTARRITDERYRARALVNISEIQASSGDIEGALYTARLIENEVSRSRALAAAGDIEGALQTARSIEDELSRARALRNISDIQAISGDIEGALQTARSIENEGYRSYALRNISEIGASSGDIEEILQTARSIEDEESRSRALADAGDIEGALATARSIESPLIRISALFYIYQSIN